MSLLAATDLEEPDTPVLRRAAQLGRHLDATVVALHGVPAERDSEDRSLEERLLLLEHAVRPAVSWHERSRARWSARAPELGVMSPGSSALAQVDPELVRKEPHQCQNCISR